MSNPTLPLEGAIAPPMIPCRVVGARLPGGRVLGRSSAEVSCHETVILPAIKVTSIHYWKWLPTLQTHLGECGVIREFVGERWWRWWRGDGGVTVSCPPVTRDGKYRELCCRLWPWCVANWGRWIMGEGLGAVGGFRLPAKMQVCTSNSNFPVLYPYLGHQWCSLVSLNALLLL